MGAFQTVILFLAVWWAWMYTTWATNWVNPERGPVRFMIAGVMVGSLILSSALPHAFGEGGLAFALAYVAIQVLRTSFVVWAMREDDKVNSRNLTRATIYFCLAGLFWICRRAERRAGHAHDIVGAGAGHRIFRPGPAVLGAVAWQRAYQ